MNVNKIFKLTCISVLLLASTQGYVQASQHNANNGNAVHNSKRSNQEDAVITKAVKKHIQASPTLSKLDVNVVTKDGVVHITGNVDSDTQVTNLVEVAESIVGVKDVNTSDLKIKDGQHPVADALITAKIKGLFIREKLFGEKDIAAINTSVETKDGVVYLSGVVDNQKQIDNAISIIKKSIPDVKKVEYSVKKSDNMDATDKTDKTDSTDSKKEY